MIPAVERSIRSVVPREVRNWLRSPSKSTAWIWDSVKYSFGFTRSLELPTGWNIVCHPHAYKVYRDSQLIDREQSAEFSNFLGHCSSSMLFFDIGAHFGVFSLAAARFGGRAVAVDPSQTATRMIDIEARLNDYSDKIQIMCAAVESSNGEIELVDSGVFSDGYLQGAAGRPKSELTLVRAVTIDTLAQQFGIPTHIKIDVEGNEAAVLRGAQGTLDRNSPLLFVELHNSMLMAEGRDPGSALDTLAERGYVTFDLSGTMIERQAILKHPIIRVVARRP